MEILATAQGENQLILSPKSNYQAEQNPPKQCSGNQAKANSHLRSVYVCKTTELRARRVGEWGTLAWGRSRGPCCPCTSPPSTWCTWRLCQGEASCEDCSCSFPGEAGGSLDLEQETPRLRGGGSDNPEAKLARLSQAYSRLRVRGETEGTRRGPGQPHPPSHL